MLIYGLRASRSAYIVVVVSPSRTLFSTPSTTFKSVLLHSQPPARRPSSADYIMRAFSADIYRREPSPINIASSEYSYNGRARECVYFPDGITDRNRDGE